MLINMEQRYNLFAQIQRDNNLVAPEFKIEIIWKFTKIQNFSERRAVGKLCAKVWKEELAI